MFHYSRPHPHVHVMRWEGDRAIRRVVAGSALILFGIGWLLKGQGLIGPDDLWLVAPAVIALSGLVRMIVAPGTASLAGGVIRFALAAYLVVVIEHIGGWTLAATWPVLLIAAGLAMVARAVLGPRLFQEPNW
jgi:hypothetical protein